MLKFNERTGLFEDKEEFCIKKIFPSLQTYNNVFKWNFIVNYAKGILALAVAMSLISWICIFSFSLLSGFSINGYSQIIAIAIVSIGFSMVFLYIAKNHDKG